MSEITRIEYIEEVIERYRSSITVSNEEIHRLERELQRIIDRESEKP